MKFTSVFVRLTLLVALVMSLAGIRPVHAQSYGIGVTSLSVSNYSWSGTGNWTCEDDLLFNIWAATGGANGGSATSWMAAYQVNIYVQYYYHDTADGNGINRTDGGHWITGSPVLIQTGLSIWTDYAWNNISPTIITNFLTDFQAEHGDYPGSTKTLLGLRYYYEVNGNLYQFGDLVTYSGEACTPIIHGTWVLGGGG